MITFLTTVLCGCDGHHVRLKLVNSSSARVLLEVSIDFWSRRAPFGWFKALKKRIKQCTSESPVLKEKQGG